MKRDRSSDPRRPGTDGEDGHGSSPTMEYDNSFLGEEPYDVREAPASLPTHSTGPLVPQASSPTLELEAQSPDIATLSDIAALIRSDFRFEEFEVTRSGEDYLEVNRSAVIGLLAWPPLWTDRYRLKQELKRYGTAPVLLVCLGRDQDMAQVPALRQRATVTCLALPTSSEMLLASLSTALDLLDAFRRAEERGQLARRYRYELGELITIATAISSERDINRLLGLILVKARYITSADAGSVYVVADHPEEPGHRGLRFEVAQNDSINLDFKSWWMEISERSIVGAALLRREVINIPDLYDLDHNNPWGVVHDRSFDDKTGYRTRSVLTVPLITQRSEVIGVLQLINKKMTPGTPLKRPEDFANVVPFDDRSVELCRTLGAQAAISLENALLYDELRLAFEGFVDASVQAIESRDPTTSGHSRRVADLTVGLAEAADRAGGELAAVRFGRDDLREIEYAALLHDFGKIGVPEPVLLKANKLHEWERDLILARFDYIRQWRRAETLQQKVELLQRGGTPVQLQAIEAALHKQEEYLDFCVESLLAANQPTVLEKEGFDFLHEIASQRYRDPRGEEKPYLTQRELDCLAIRRGSLSVLERKQIESHVEHTHRFLCMIPWGRALQKIPLIAGDHHEKLDGSGYPSGKPAAEIPVQARMMAISDIFDALTASDRPYKRAVPYQKALAILEDEVKQGKLDPLLYRLFVEAEVWRRVIRI
jgi:HD-GYP domain-containing protein (c-di-GMP phosphodiesterase class II)